MTFVGDVGDLDVGEIHPANKITRIINETNIIHSDRLIIIVDYYNILY